MTDDATRGLSGRAGTMVQAYLDRHGKTPDELPSGVLVVPLVETPDGSPWQMWFAGAGADGQALVVQIRAAYRIGRPAWPAALEACNAWNRTARLAKAWLAVEDWDTSPDGSLVVEASLPAADEAEQSMIDALADGVLLGAFEFWQGHLGSFGRTGPGA